MSVRATFDYYKDEEAEDISCDLEVSRHTGEEDLVEIYTLPVEGYDVSAVTTLSVPEAKKLWEELGFVLGEQQ